MYLMFSGFSAEEGPIGNNSTTSSSRALYTKEYIRNLPAITASAHHNEPAIDSLDQSDYSDELPPTQHPVGANAPSVREKSLSRSTLNADRTSRKSRLNTYTFRYILN